MECVACGDSTGSNSEKYCKEHQPIQPAALPSKPFCTCWLMAQDFCLVHGSLADHGAIRLPETEKRRSP